MSAKESNIIAQKILATCSDHVVSNNASPESTLDILVALSYVFVKVCKGLKIDPIDFARQAQSDFHDSKFEQEVN